jgi:hypothetical protein
MSRPKIVTPAIDEIVVEEAIHRLTKHTNKQLVRLVKQRTGADLSADYLGKLVAEEMRYQKSISPSSDVSRGTTENVDSSRTIG